MRRRLLTKKNNSESILVEDTLACDVVFYNPDIDELVIRREENTWQPNETPVGIVVIPASHGVLKDGTGTVNQCGVISLKEMTYTNPQNGSASNSYIYWGGYGNDISGKSDGLGRYDSVSNGLLNYNKVACDTSGSNKSTKLSNNDYAYMARQTSSGGTPSWYSSASSYGYVPTPYIGSDLKSGGYNTDYGTTNYDNGTNYNCLADFKGIVNTKIITDLATAEDWKNVTTLTESYSTGYYPAACACARYKTTGTKSFAECTTEELKNGTGFWYLPSIGELGYILPRLYDINATINSLRSSYGNSVGVSLSTGYCYWSSSEYRSGSTRYVYTDDGGVYYDGKDNGYYVRAFLQLGPDTINKDDNITNNYEFVDMGLSVKWATCNIGATKPEEYGWYFQWGETTAYNSDRTPVEGGSAISFSWSNYKYCDGTEYSMTKYCTDSSYGTVDNKTVLDPEDDAAHVHIGGDCRMPTETEFNELINACNTRWVTNYNGSGINGCLFTLKTDPSKTLFFPASGYLDKTSWGGAGSLGYCWSSSLYSSNSYYGRRLYFGSSNCYMNGGNRYSGWPVRAVKPK